MITDDEDRDEEREEGQQAHDAVRSGLAQDGRANENPENDERQRQVLTCPSGEVGVSQEKTGVGRDRRLHSKQEYMDRVRKSHRLKG